MPVIHLGNGVLQGLFADTKPTTYPAGSTFLETDTGATYTYSGSTWLLTSGSQLIPATYIIYNQGSVTKSFKSSTQATASNSSAATIIQNAINDLSTTASGGRICLKAGTYTLTTQLTITDTHEAISLEGEGYSVFGINPNTKIIFSLGGDSSASFDGLLLTGAHECQIRDIQFTKSAANGCRYIMNQNSGCLHVQVTGCYFSDNFSSNYSTVLSQNGDANYWNKCGWNKTGSIVGGETSTYCFFSTTDLQTFMTDCHFAATGAETAPYDGINIVNGRQIKLENITVDSLRHPFTINNFDCVLSNVGFYNNKGTEGNNPIITAGSLWGNWTDYGSVSPNQGFKSTSNNFLSGTFAIDSTGIKTITFAHTLAFAPRVQDCTPFVVENTAVDDWGYDLLKVVSTDTTNITCKIHVSTQSATAGATAKLAMRMSRPTNS
jgi:hypothetical protein